MAFGGMASFFCSLSWMVEGGLDWGVFVVFGLLFCFDMGGVGRSLMA